MKQLLREIPQEQWHAPLASGSTWKCLARGIREQGIAYGVLLRAQPLQQQWLPCVKTFKHRQLVMRSRPLGLTGASTAKQWQFASSRGVHEPPMRNKGSMD
jgi:hypothetical protein